MKVCNINREALYAILNFVYTKMAIRPRILELGVLRGENAEIMRSALTPELLILVDAWSSKVMTAYCRINAHKPWVNEIEAYADYFGGSPLSQKTFDEMYALILNKFSNSDDVLIIREDTQEAAKILQKDFINHRGIDLIYVDANHQYESVLEDLMTYKDLLSTNGFFQLNDCCFSTSGVRQNLGVLEAVCQFIKITDYVPLILTNTEFSDLLIAPRTTSLYQNSKLR